MHVCAQSSSGDHKTTPIVWLTYSMKCPDWLAMDIHGPSYIAI